MQARDGEIAVGTLDFRQGLSRGQTRVPLPRALRRLVGRTLAAIDDSVLRQAFVVEPAGLDVLSAFTDTHDHERAYFSRSAAHAVSAYGAGRCARDEHLRHTVEMLSQLPSGQCIVGCFPRRFSLLARLLYFPDDRMPVLGRSDLDAMMLRAGVHAYHVSALGPVYLLLAWK